MAEDVAAVAPAREKPLVSVSNLKIHFPIHSGLLRRRTGEVRAVDGVSFDIAPGETLGLVGESGCGKSTTGRAVLRLYDPTDGFVRFGDTSLADLTDNEMRAMRPNMQMIFQDPQACLNPRMTVGAIIAEPLVEHTSLSASERREKVRSLLDSVGMNPDFVNRYPHEFSGGQRQRIGIARALALDPDFIVCDEPIAALDVSIQAQVVNLLQDLQQERGLTYLFISHDLSMVQHIADRVAVMYLGKIMELAPVDVLYERPAHPYTKALMSAVPVADPTIEMTRERTILTGDVPSPAKPPAGCVFCTRCPVAEKKCFTVPPEWRELESGHSVACHLVG
ncbi:MAG: oligopeptide/dipeptide ABC transporter ATP-binding protein [Pseudomonadota bacterium]